MPSPVSFAHTVILVLSVLLLGCTMTTLAAESPHRERRILYNSDGSNALAEHWMWSSHRGAMTLTEKQDLIEESIDEIAAAGVDTLSVVAWEKFMSNLASSDVCPDTYRLKRLQYLDMVEAGRIPIEIMIDRCRRHGLEFISTFRMNDNHASPPARFIVENPEVVLVGQQVNYAHDAVRTTFLAFMEEFLTRHDVDGIQFDYLRNPNLFPDGTGAAHAHLLTDLTRRARALLDAAAKRRGRSRLMLGVRVPQTLEECRALGFDVGAWIREGLIDWVVPSDFFYTDLNARTEDFVALTAGTSCRIYPALHPVTCVEDNVGINGLEHYRAAARNFYAFGASGIEAYNYQYHWGRRIGRTPPWSSVNWPAALGYLGQLRNPEQLVRFDRHYRFFRLWSTAPTGFAKDDRIQLDVSQKDPEGRFRFRVAEDLEDPTLRAILHFKAAGLSDGEDLEITLNGMPVPDRWVIRKWFSRGRPETQGRPLPPFHEYTIDLGRGPQRPPIMHGDNELFARLLHNTDPTKNPVTIDEVEMYVYVRQPKP